VNSNLAVTVEGVISREHNVPVVFLFPTPSKKNLLSLNMKKWKWHQKHLN